MDSGARRHTSFVSVWVYPAVEDDINISIDEKDIRIDTYRPLEREDSILTQLIAKNYTLLIQIVVQCQNERSQTCTKLETCFKMLRARLYEYEIKKEEDLKKS